MSKKIDLKILQLEIKTRIKEFYPYFLGFYILSLIMSVFSKTWTTFFYWPAFHRAIVFFGLLFVFSSFDFTISDLNKKSIRQIVPRLRVGVIDFFRQIFKRILFVYNKLSNLNRRTKLKVLFTMIILILALSLEVGVLNFIALFYALVSIAFFTNIRRDISLALFFLGICPLFLILKKDTLAESMAVLAYYFLVVSVLAKIREAGK